MKRQGQASNSSGLGRIAPLPDLNPARGRPLCNRKKMMGRNVNPGLTEPKLLGCRFAYGSRQGIQATFEDPQGRVVPGRPHPVKAYSHRNTHNASQDYRLPLDCPFLGAFLAVHNTAITPISGSAGKNRNQPSINQILASKPQVTKGYNRGLVGGTRSFPALPNSESLRSQY